MLQTNTYPNNQTDVSDPKEILRSCITCGCCNDICPTFTVLNDENDGPRGRINLMRDMIENGKAPDSHTVKHLDRCLTCTACQTICPVGVDYMHLIDEARVEIEENYTRPLLDRVTRNMLADTLPYPEKFLSKMALARRFKWTAPLLEMVRPLRPLAALMNSVPNTLPRREDILQPGYFTAKSDNQARVLIPSGCVQKIIDSDINRAAIDLLTAAGVDVVLPENDKCCGALDLHLGKRERTLQKARDNIDVWYPLLEEGLDAIVITTSGCGTTIKDYGSLLAQDPDYADRATAIAALALDVTEFLSRITLPEPIVQPDIEVAYHAACSLQHTQRVKFEPRKLLLDAGFKLQRPRDENMCCGSAGTYSFLQPEIAGELRRRKADSLSEGKPDVIAGGNLGCLTHISQATEVPLVHTVQLLAWVYAGQKPKALR